MKNTKILMLTLITLLTLTLSACSSEVLITFDSNGGSLVEYQLVESSGKAIKPEDPVKIGYSLDYWSYNGVEYDFNSKVKEDIELKAVWDEKTIYNVNYSLDGGLTMANQTIYDGDKIVKPDTPVKENYTFLGWTLNGEVFNFDTIITDDIVDRYNEITLSAVWSRVYTKQYVVTFENSDVISQVVNSNETATKPTDPKKIHNEFLGWFVEDVEFNFNSRITEDIVVTAKWAEEVFEGQTVYVDNTMSNSQINTVASALNPGDTLIFKDGTYSGISLEIKANTSYGTESQKITIKSETVNGAIISGSIQWKFYTDYFTIDGFKFIDGYAKSSAGAIVIYGHHIRLTNILMDAFDKPGTVENGYSDGTKTGYVSVQDGAMFAEIDHCTFINKSAQGCLLLVDKNNYEGPTYAHIHDNYFGEFHNVANLSNEYETIRVGISSCSQTDSYTIIEDNIFENIDAETELVSIKSCKNVVRNNLILNCASAITLRHGNSCLVEGNIILNEGTITDSNGIRVFDGYHVIRNNYISGIAANSSTFYGGIVIHNGNNSVGSEGNSLSGQWTANNLLIENNSFVNNSTNICLGDTRYEVAPGNITLQNNFVYTNIADAKAFRQTDQLNVNSGVTQKSVLATNVTYSNEYYYASALGLVTSEIPTSGINFNDTWTASDVMTSTGSSYDGYAYPNTAYEKPTYNYSIIESTVAGVGATNLQIPNRIDACVQDETTNALSLTKTYFLAEFQDWPFAAANLDTPELDDMLSDYTGVTLEDDLSKWKNTVDVDDTTFAFNSVMKITGGATSTSNTISIGELSSYIAISYDVYFEDVNNFVGGIKVYSGGTSSANEVARVKIEDSLFKMQYSYGTDSNGLKTSYYDTRPELTSGRWYTISFVFVTAVDSSVSLSANVYIDGELIMEDVACLRSFETITHIGFYSDSEITKKPLYINNLMVVGRKFEE